MHTSGKKNHQVTALNTSADLDGLIRRVGDARVVMLGEASHGTHEYYTWRTAISKRLIKEKGFSFIAVEGDWPDCYRVNRFIKEPGPLTDTHTLLREFNRWPTWMWSNYEVSALVSWLKTFNNRAGKKAGFYGLDVYSLWESMETLIDYLKDNDPQALGIAEKALDCFSGAGRNEQQYAFQSITKPCREAVVKLLGEVRQKSKNFDNDPEEELNARQNAHIAVEAEKYYRNMVNFDEETWNIRDSHMMETLDRLLQFYGDHSKAIVWEHNTHIGDARFTDMKDAGLFNIGQLAREKYGRENVALVGFGSYSGSVAAGKAWGAPMQVMKVPDAMPGSFEALLHNESRQNRYIIFNGDEPKYPGDLAHRAIGVVYNPDNERRNYVPSKIEERYDAFIYIDRTTALHPIKTATDHSQVPETYPFEF
jgi:erythromycin esterase